MDCPRPRSSRSSSSIQIAFTGRSLGGAHSVMEGYAQYHHLAMFCLSRAISLNLVGEADNLMTVADGVHNEAGVDPQHSDFFCWVGADTGHHLHGIALGHIGYCSTLGNGVASPKPPVVSCMGYLHRQWPLGGHGPFPICSGRSLASPAGSSHADPLRTWFAESSLKSPVSSVWRDITWVKNRLKRSVLTNNITALLHF